MFSWDDAVYSLSGRVKSVVIVALTAFVVAQQGQSTGAVCFDRGAGTERVGSENGTVYGQMADGGSRIAEAVDGNSVVNSADKGGGNPIDAYFGGMESSVRGGAEEVSFANIYLDSWEKELRQAYGVLVEALEGDYAYGGRYAEEAGEKFAEFAEVQGWLEAYLGTSVSIAADEDAGTSGEGNPDAGTGNAEKGILSADKAYGKAELTRWLTLRIYGMLESYVPAGKTAWWNGEFRFSEKEAEAALEECGLLKTT